MSIFIESIWVWIGLAVLIGVVGAVAFQQNRQPRTLGMTVLGVVLILALGFALNHFIDTDQKSIRRMLDGLIVAIEHDDIELVVSEYVSPKAEKTKAMARANMLLVKISNARYQDLKIEVNDMTSPPIAKTSFKGVLYWKPKTPINGFSFNTPQLQVVRFDMELEKTQDNSWRVTDNLQFNPRATP